MNVTSLELRSEMASTGQLRLSLAEQQVSTPGPDEVIVRVEAAPINPSDIAELLGPADVATLSKEGTTERPVTTATTPDHLVRLAAARTGRSLVPGLEGAGVVVDAGVNAQHLLGKVVSSGAGRMYTQYRRLQASDVVSFPEGVTPARGAAAYVNPLTALGMLSTMRLEGHSALVHTAAASNLEQMLNKLCIADGVQVINVVRSAGQKEILRAIGASYVVNSANAEFLVQLTSAISETGATLAFDAVGGGALGGQILAAIEAARVAKSAPVRPLWLASPQAAVHLWPAGSIRHDHAAVRRHGMGHRGLAPAAPPDPHWSRGNPHAARSRRERDYDDLRQRLHERDLAG
jgi:NADPH2:quinone reductase